MKVYHIIEIVPQDQQTVEIHADSQERAMQVYLEYSTNDPLLSVRRHGNCTTWNYADEVCKMTAQTEYLVFARWTHKRGLY
jgi:hypothetical protein